jgi:tRNA A-37 threonylcarbamoyl transferase component Bud32
MAAHMSNDGASSNPSLHSACSSDLPASTTLAETPAAAGPSDLVVSAKAKFRQIAKNLRPTPLTVNVESVELRDALLGVLRPTAKRPNRRLTLSVIETALGAKPDWADAKSASEALARELAKNLRSSEWTTTVRAALLYHSLLWHGGNTFLEAVFANPPPQCSELVETYESNVCGQGPKQRPIVQYAANMLSFIVTAGHTVRPQEILHIYNNGLHAPKGNGLHNFTDVSGEAPNSPNRMLMRCVALQTYLSVLLSAMDLPLLALDNELSIEVVDRVIFDSKAVFVCLWRHMELLLDSKYHAQHLVQPEDLPVWSSLCKSFSNLSQRLAVFLCKLRDVAVEFTEEIPEISVFPVDAVNKLEELVEARKAAQSLTPRPQSMSEYIRDNSEASVHKTESDLDQGPASARQPPHAADQNLNQTLNSVELTLNSFPESQSSPVTTVGLTLPFAKQFPPKMKTFETFKEGALTDEEKESNDKSSPFDRTSYNLNSQIDIETRYAMGDVIGKGAYGSVYRAFDTDEGHFVAVKELEVRRAPDETFASDYVRELVSEFELLIAARHDNIVSVEALDISKPERPRIVMEWMPGGSIQGALKLTKTGFKETVVAFYLKQALAGLAFLHSRNIVHRDIKPGNMLLSAAGVVKLSDFGTSRLIKADSMQTGTVVGTIPFLAPECFKGTYSTGSDVWALGCSALEMLTGRMPWSERGCKDTISLVFIIGNAVPPEHHPMLPPKISEEIASPLVPGPSGGPGGLQCGQGAISELAHDFLMQCFTYDHKVRPTAAELLEHPFLKGA